MKLPRYGHAVTAALAASSIGPLYVAIRSALTISYFPDKIAFTLWPFYRYFLGPDFGYDDPKLADTYLALSLATNVLFYFGVFSAVWGVAWLIRARIHSDRGRRSNQSLQPTAGSSDN